MVVAQGLGDADRRAPRILRRNRDPKTTDAFTGVRLLAGNSWPAPGLATPASDIQLAQEVYRGPRGGEVYRGPRGGEAYRGPHGGGRAWAIWGGTAVRGQHGGYRVGHRFYGGVWYGTGRHWYRGHMA